MSSDTTHVDPASPGSECRCAEFALDLRRLVKVVERVVDVQERLIKRLDAISPEQGQVQARAVSVIDEQGRPRVELSAHPDRGEVVVLEANGCHALTLVCGDDEEGGIERALHFGIEGDIPFTVALDGDGHPLIQFYDKGHGENVAPLLFNLDDKGAVPYHNGLSGVFEAVESHEKVIMAIHDAANLG